MKTKIRLGFVLSTLILLLFILFTAAVKIYDVKPVGPNGSMIGFSTLNTAFFGEHGENPFLYEVTEILGYFALLTAALFGLVGFLQLIKFKSLKRVDHSILALGVFYAVVIGCYIFFEVFVINYRPVLIDGALEASYPSSHTMLAVCIMATAIIQFNRRLHSTGAKVTADCIFVLVMGIIVTGRLLSGVHWFTDIVGSLLLSASLIMFYYSAVRLLDWRREMREETEAEEERDMYVQY